MKNQAITKNEEQELEYREVADDGTERLEYDEFHSGPLPDPTTLAKYKQIDPKAVAVIIDEFAKQGDHVRELDQQIMKHNIQLKYLGFVVTAILMLIFVSLGAYLLYQDKKIEAFAAFAVPVLKILIETFVSKEESQPDKEDV